MEKDRKNHLALLLMVVGIIFIVVSGTIFVSTAWRYLPTAGKQGVLFLGTILLFLAAERMARNCLMEKTEAALYYLGTSCLGLFTLSACGEYMFVARGQKPFYSLIGWNAEAILIAGVMMLLPVALRFVKKRTALDFVMMALLVDWVLFWVQMAGGFGWLGACVISAIGLTAYALADYLREQWMKNNGRVELAFIVLYHLHAINFIVHHLTLPWLEDVFTYRLCLFLMALFMTGISVFMQLSRNYRILRVFNSLAIYWSILTGVNLLQTILKGQNVYLWNEEMLHFLAFTLCAMVMVLMQRKEMVVITVVWGGILPFFQIWTYGDYDFLFSHIHHQVSPYVPFSGVLALALGYLIFRKHKDGSLDREEALRYLLVTAIQGILMLVVLYASKYPFWEKGIYSLLILQSLAISFLLRNPILSRCFKTSALFFGELLLVISTHMDIFSNYEVERLCLLAAWGIYLIGVIWNQHGYFMKSFQFVSMCLLMLVLLSNAVLQGYVGNALVLGAVGVVMLCFSAYCNSRRYAVLSSVILIILAFYVTRSFWCSIAWWVYLFAAGVVLVILAVRKERIM